MKQAKRLGMDSFGGFTNPAKALSLLTIIEKILQERMHCPNEDNLRIVGFLLEYDAKKWWVNEQTTKCHT